MKKEKTLSDAEILQYLYGEGLVDIIGEGENLTLHSDTTGKGLLNIFRAGYKKAKQEDKQCFKEILDGIEDLEYKESITETLDEVIKIIKQKSGDLAE